MRDVLPPESMRMRAATGVFADVVTRAGYGEVVPPLLEDIGVFARLGDGTDVVTKEMYDFVDKGGRHIALRPEQTASVCRLFVEHRPPTPFKAWYAGANFRYEKPQRGRYRQFDQFGVEVLGSSDPDLDVEVIALAHDFYRSLGLTGVDIVINSLGLPADRAAYTTALGEFCRSRAADLSEAGRDTLAKNPLRLLDSKRPEDRAALADAPPIDEFWSEEAAQHHEHVLRGLTSLGIEFTEDRRLVRGLDYYRLTTFEFRSSALDGAQNAVGGGGRYDGLVEDLGGPPTPGVGFALGVERTLLACDAESVFSAPGNAADVFIVDTAGCGDALVMTAEIRRSGLRCERAYDARSMKAQMKAADRSGARVAIIVGEHEAQTGTVTIREMSGAADQQSISRNEVVEYIHRLLNH